MTDLVGGVEPERQEAEPELLLMGGWICVLCADGTEGECHSPGCLFFICPAPSDEQAARLDPRRNPMALPAVPAGFGERLAQAIEGLRPDEPDEPIRFEAYESYGYDLGQIKALDSAAALVREQFTQLAGHDRNKT